MTKVYFIISFFVFISVLPTRSESKQLLRKQIKKTPGRDALLYILNDVLRSKNDDNSSPRKFKKPAKRTAFCETKVDLIENDNKKIKWKKYADDNINLREGNIIHNYFDLKDTSRDQLKNLKNTILNMKILEINNRHNGYTGPIVIPGLG
ncbi:uncharacterized protein LOC113508651 [Trichoplusia ni]|uniref:Uncharacterized protein LOC113508651 n=1 Tax=Trichoplusia ni TaxID=7111 RepID=A0A7E5X541_TRINI|nr:uncharacterized protein LOC113508651 [Trichoplusia ni]